MQESENVGRTQVYELGYHIIPSMREDDLPSEVSALRSLIEGQKGIVISDEFPKARNLSYPLFHTVAGVKQKYVASYFGWVKFEGSSSVIKAVEEGVKKNPHVLRYLLIKTVRESTLYSLKIAQSAKMQGSTEIRKVKTEPRKEGPQMTTEEMDKTIEELIKE